MFLSRNIETPRPRPAWAHDVLSDTTMTVVAEIEPPPHRPLRVIVSFRGTKSLSNVQTDCNFVREEITLGGHAQVTRPRTPRRHYRS
jgi:hypothetical protein